MDSYREPNLDQYKSIWLTEEAYKKLRKEKEKQKLSMAQIVDNLILKNNNEKKI